MDELDQLEDIEFSSDHEELRALQDDLAVLNRYYDEIAATGGISRDQAILLVRDCGLKWDENYPIESFTEVPSRTNYGVAVESLSLTVVNKVWELIKRAASLLLKIARWIMDAIRSAAGRATHVEAAVEVTADMVKIDRSYPAPAQVVDTPAVKAARRQLEQCAEAYMENYNDLVEDLLGDAAYHTAIRNVAIDVLPFLDVTEAKLSLYTDLVQQLGRNPNAVTLAVIKQQLATIAEPLRSSRTRAHFQHVNLPATQTDGLVEMVAQLRQAQLSLRNQRTSNNSRWARDPEAALNQVAFNADDIRYTAPYITDIGHWHDRLDKMARELDRIVQLHVPAFAALEVATVYQFHTAFKTIEQEFQAYRTIIVTAESTRTVRDQLIYDLFEYQKAQLALRKELLQAAGDAEGTRRFVAELQRLREKIRVANQKAA